LQIKFGVVWLVTLREDSAEQVSVDNKPVSILGHFSTTAKMPNFITNQQRNYRV